MRTAQQSASLATKYAVGEIADFVGVPDFYDAGSSKWMKTGTWVNGALLPDAARTSLMSMSANVVITDNVVFLNESPRLNTVTPLAKTSSVVAIPMSAGDGRALVINSDGMQIVGYAQTSFHGVNGGNHLITSDGTTLFSWGVANSGSEFSMSSSTDGLTWTAQTLTGQAAHTALNVAPIGPGGNQASNVTPAGDAFVSGTTYINIAAWCGARHLLVGKNASNQYLAQRSANGIAWGGDESTTILGSATQTGEDRAWWYRNGLNFFLALNGVSRKSADGGVTWAAATNTLTLAGATFYRVNSTDPARIAVSRYTDIRFSTDSGATWTNRTAPFSITPSTTTLYGRGAVWVLTNMDTGAAWKTIDDGATWNRLFAPAGFNSRIQSVMADAYRWYMASAAGNQVATSTDAVTWTVRNISNPAPSELYLSAPCYIASLDANTICATSHSSGNRLISLDGGVTWAWANSSSSTTFTAKTAKNLIANTVGTPSFIGGAIGSTDEEGKTSVAVITAADFALGGKYFRSTSSVVPPLRTNALAYSRIA